MSVNLRNMRGAGLQYFSDVGTNEHKIFKAGIRHYRRYDYVSTPGQMTSQIERHDKLDYERGMITHSRAPIAQYYMWQFMFGGPKKYLYERFFCNYLFNTMGRITWFPILVLYIYFCYTMRVYENNGYNFFYFSD